MYGNNAFSWASNIRLLHWMIIKITNDEESLNLNYKLLHMEKLKISFCLGEAIGIICK